MKEPIRIISVTYLPSRFMFCEIAPFSVSMVSIILTGSSWLRPEGLFCCGGPLVAPMLCRLLPGAANLSASLCLPSAQVALTSVSVGNTERLSVFTSTISTSLCGVMRWLESCEKKYPWNYFWSSSKSQRRAQHIRYSISWVFYWHSPNIFFFHVFCFTCINPNCPLKSPSKRLFKSLPFYGKYNINRSFKI